MTPVDASSPEPSTSQIARNILALAAPTTLLASLQLAAQLVETALAARQGTAALAGWAVVLPFALLMQQMSTGAMGGGVVAAIARALGAQRRDEAAALVLHAIIIAVLGGLAFALGLSAFGGWMLDAVAGPQAAQAATAYVWWLFGVGAVPVWLTNTFASVLRGGGRHALAARSLTLMWLVYPVLAWALAEPAGLGLTGLGLAFALVSWVAALVMAVTVLRGGAGFMPTLRARPTKLLFVRILSVGAVACALATIANLTTILVTAQLRSYGTVAVAAYGISARLEFMMIPLSFGIGAALTALVGRSVGAGEWRTARRTAWTGGLMALAVTGVAGLGVGLMPLAFVSVFTADPEVARIAALALSWIGPAFGGFGLGMAMYFAAMGAQRMRWPIVAGLTRLSLAVLLGGWLANTLGWGLQGHFVGVALGISAYGVLAAAGVRPGVWSAR
ncbi:MAG: hypothetical protein RLZZ401_1763 [Pseudomonadota bacterium]